MRNQQDNIQEVIHETERHMEHTGRIGNIRGLHFECLYCSFTCKQFKELLSHWETTHKEARK